MVSWVGFTLIAFGNATRISLDRKRRGRPVGAWRFAAIFLGPVVICLCVILEYRERSIFLLPIVVAVYGATIILRGIAVVLLQRAWL